MAAFITCTVDSSSARRECGETSALSSLLLLCISDPRSLTCVQTKMLPKRRRLFAGIRARASRPTQRPLWVSQVSAPPFPGLPYPVNAEPLEPVLRDA
jgi:hypothetical protein